eukprot:m.96673 g.96673  ORF g.96673 m.96673 type:complete len:759 (-) comp8640_c0_seq3:380-2656(-)
MAERLDVWGRRAGTLRAKDHVLGMDGLLTSLVHTRRGRPGECVRFVRLAFGGGGRLVAADHRANIYLLDIAGNTFTLVARAPLAITSLCFAERDLVLAGLADSSISALSLDTGAWHPAFSQHATCVHSMTARRGVIASVSVDDAMLWPICNPEQWRCLSGRGAADIKEVFFSPDGAWLFTCFRNDTIVVWDAATLQVYHRFPAPTPPGQPAHLRTFAVSPDGSLLFAAGRTRRLFVWDVCSRALSRAIELPPRALAARSLQAAGAPDGTATMLAALCTDGVVRLIDTTSGALVEEIAAPERGVIDVMQLSSDGRYLAAVATAGLSIYDLPHRIAARRAHAASQRAASAELTAPRPGLRDGQQTGLRDDQQTGLRPVSMETIDRRASDAANNGAASSSAISEGLTTAVSSVSSEAVVEAAATLESQPPGQQRLDPGTLRALLHTYGEFPVKYRPQIWLSLLDLPLNEAAYNALIEQNDPAARARMPDDHGELHRTLCALAAWAPGLTNLPYLPRLIDPFVHIFQHSPLQCFEAAAAFLANWCQQWFDFAPNPPINILNMIESVLAHHDAALHAHFSRHMITAQHYAWPLLQTLFSGVLTAADRAVLVDNVVCEQPAYLLMAVVAFNVHNRIALCRATSHEAIKLFFVEESASSIGAIIHLARQLDRDTPAPIHPGSHLRPYQALTRGQYPPLAVPTSSVDHERVIAWQLQAEDHAWRERQVLLRTHHARPDAAGGLAFISSIRRAWDTRARIARVSSPG